MNDDTEKITVSKAVSGIAKPKNFIKLGIQGINLSLIVLVICGIIFIKNLFFATNTQKQTTVVRVEKGAQVGSITTSTHQEQEQNKKTAGLEIFGSSNDGGVLFKKYINNNMYAGIGAAWIFRGDDEGEVKPEIRVGFDF